MSSPPPNPLQQLVRWLAANTRFPASRLDAKSEAMLCMARLAEAEEAAAGEHFLIQRRDGAKDAALRAHTLRRSLVHFKCDNSAKV